MGRGGRQRGVEVLVGRGGRREWRCWWGGEGEGSGGAGGEGGRQRGVEG